VLQTKIASERSVAFKKANCVKNSHEGNKKKTHKTSLGCSVSSVLHAVLVLPLQFQNDTVELKRCGTTSEQCENKYTASLRHSEKNSGVRDLQISKFATDKERSSRDCYILILVILELVILLSIQFKTYKRNYFFHTTVITQDSLPQGVS